MTAKLSCGRRRNAEAISADVRRRSRLGMVEEANNSRSAVSWGACLAAAAVAASPVGATVARAGDDRHWKRKRHHHSPPYSVAVPPVPMAWAPAYPAYGPPVGSLNFGLSVPLH
jgi:hypothetical protein